MRDELDARIRSLTAERQRPDPGERLGTPHMPAGTEALLTVLIGLLHKLFQKENCS